MAKLGVPSKPVYRFAGQLQPPAFGEGIEAFRRFAAEVLDKACAAPSDRDLAEAHAGQVSSMLQIGGAFSLGFAAALTEWFAIHRHSTVPDVESHQPLVIGPRDREVNGNVFYDPPPNSRFFDVDGMAVAVGEDLYAAGFGPADYVPLDVSVVRDRGKPITRDRFDELRGKAEDWSAALREWMAEA